MAPSRRRHRLRCWPSSPCHVDFRAQEDDAWYGVSLRVEEAKDTFLRVMYCGFPVQWDERFPCSRFRDADELEAFRQRFRRTSRQMQDSECRRVAEGMSVCASSVVNDDELKFYDATVLSVCYSDHKFLNGEENCMCVFALVWKHGPNNGNMTSMGIEHICLLEDGDTQIDVALDLFLEAARKKLEAANQTPKESHEPTVKREIEGSNSPDGLRLVEDGQDVDLRGSCFPLILDSENSFYFIWIENLDKDLSPEAIVDFLHGHTSILAQALVFPTLCSIAYTRATIIVDTREKMMKLSSFLFNTAHIVISINGRPWVITEKNWSYGSLAGFLPKFERQPSIHTGDKIILAREGSIEFEKGMQWHTLFLEFHEHILRLHRSLALKEWKIMQLSS